MIYNEYFDKNQFWQKIHSNYANINCTLKFYVKNIEVLYYAILYCTFIPKYFMCLKLYMFYVPFCVYVLKIKQKILILVLKFICFYEKCSKNIVWNNLFFNNMTVQTV